MNGPEAAAARGSARPRLVLASSSPGRRDLLLAAGITPIVVVSEVDERAVAAASGIAGDDAAAVTELLARAKAQDVAGRILAGTVPTAQLGGPATTEHPVLVVGADSMLSFAGHVLGKAQDGEDVAARWERFAGNWAQLYTGHHVICLPDSREVGTSIATRVRAGHPTARELADYIATGEPLAVAGSCTLDGFGGAFIAEIQGDPSNVIGLSLPNLRLLVGELGFGWTQLWDPQLTGSARQERG